jgi:membrane-bound metal-dependent hydrolase YbcI (DUF457 family)
VFAINHAATALLIRRRYPDVPFVPILVSVQAMELLWVALNYLGVERTTTEPVVRYVGDIHLEFMPYSHSVGTMLAVAGLSWAGGVAFRRPRLGAAFGIGVLSHLLLDLATHNGDIALAPFAGGERYGTYLYGRLPALAFVIELSFGVLCWWVYRGRQALLAVIVGFNLADLSLFFAALPGPEAMLAGRSALLVALILVQIVITLWAIWWAADHRPGGGRSRLTGSPANSY